MDEYFPLNFAYRAFEPVGGRNESLNPVIFLHGALGSKEVWDDIPQLIADETKRKTYAYDARNHGETDYSNVFSFDLNVEDLLYFMDTMNIPKAVLVGHSMGGYTACRAALKKPERIEMIFSEDMYVKKIPEGMFQQIRGFTKLLIDAVKNVPISMNNEEAKNFVLNELFNQASPDAVYSHEKESLSKTSFLFKHKPDGSYDVSFNKCAILKAYENYDQIMSEAEGEFGGPAYFLYGNLSFMNVGSEEESIKRHFPKAELIEFEGATHNVHVEFKERFVNVVLNCLTA